MRLPLNGVLTPATRSAIRSFQEREKLPVTGIVGPDTERALIAASSGQSPGAGATKPVEPGMMEPPGPAATPPEPGMREPAGPAPTSPAAEFEFEWEVALLGQRETQRLTYSGQVVRFPSGEILRVVTGLPIGKHEDYWDPTGSRNPLLDTGPAHKDKKLSTSFTVRELTASGGVSADVARIDPKLVECLQRLRDHVGKGVKINSGFRSWKRNRDIYEKRGKTPTLSQHCAGRGADILIAGMNGLEIGKAAIDACGPKIGVGLGNTFAHIDVRGSAAAWNYGGVKDSWVAEIKRYQKGKGSPSRKPSTAGAKVRPDAAKRLPNALVRRTTRAPTAPVPSFSLPEKEDSFAENSERENWSLDPELTDRLQDESSVDEAESWDWEAAPEFELLPETAAVRSSRAGEQYVDASTWNADPLRAHGGTGANVLLRWNDVPSDTRSIDVVVHLHGYIGPSPNAQMLRAVAARSGLDLSGRTRPTLAILPRGRRITAEEVRQRQAHLNEFAKRSGKKPGTARSDVYTFPALWRDGGAGLASLITGALQWFAQQRSGGAALPIARLIFTAHSGGGAALDRLVALHARRKVCNPDEVHAFDALYSQADGLKSWVSARLRADRGAAGYGGGLRVLYRGGTQRWSEHLARSLPGRGHALSRRYRAECTRVGHLEIPNAFGPALLRDAAADLAALQPCSGGAPSKPATSKSSRPKQSRSNTPARSGAGPRTPERAALPSDVAGWIRSTDRSALELIADESQRRKLLQEIDWSREYFPGNKDAQQGRAPGRLAEELFLTMARVVPEHRVPSGIRYHDVTRVVASVPGQPDHKLFPEAREAFVRMREAAAADGVQLRITSSWRSLARQQVARKQQDNPNAVARGISAHMYGLAVDLNMRVAGLSLVNASTRAKDRMANIVRMYRSPNYKWLVLNASRFGWFPYRREPWHWEYNPPGFAARFEGSVGTGTAREFGGDSELDGGLMPEISTPTERVLEFITKWGRNASPFKIANTYLKLHWKGISYWRDVSKSAKAGRDLLKRIDGLERGARALKRATDEQHNAEWKLPSYPRQTDDKAGHIVVTHTELDYVEKYFNTAAMIANDALDARVALDRAIAGWDAVVEQANKTNDFTRKAAWEAITYLNLRFSNEGGSFRAYLVNARDTAARVEYWARMKQYHGAHILGKWTPEWYEPPTPPG